MKIQKLVNKTSNHDNSNQKTRQLKKESTQSLFIFQKTIKLRKKKKKNSRSQSTYFNQSCHQASTSTLKKQVDLTPNEHLALIMLPAKETPTLISFLRPIAKTLRKRPQKQSIHIIQRLLVYKQYKKMLAIKINSIQLQRSSQMKFLLISKNKTLK